MHARVPGNAPVFEHDRVVDGLKVTVSDGAHRSRIAVHYATGAIQHLAAVGLHRRPFVFACDRDEPHPSLSALSWYCPPMTHG